MSLAHTLIRSQFDTIPQEMIRELRLDTEGKKFVYVLLRRLTNDSDDKIADYFTDKGGDHQVDGVYSKMGVDDFELGILTAKFSSNENSLIPDHDVLDFINVGVQYILTGEKNVRDINDWVQEHKTNYDDLKVQYQNKHKVKLLFVSTSKKQLSPNGESIVRKFIVDCQKSGLSIDFAEIGLDRLSTLFVKKANLNIDFPIRLSGRTYYTLPNREGFLCRLAVQEIIKMYDGFEDDKGTSYPGYGDFLFEDNVRRSFGLETQINAGIYKTATDPIDAINFEYFNNGITVLYDERKGHLQGDSPIIYMRGFQIVNGCQTVSTLVQAHKDGNLSDELYVNCKFIRNDRDNSFVNSLITYTNSQNAISDRDLHSNDKVQLQIQEIIARFGYFYERKKGEHSDKSFDKRIDALDAIQAYLACELESPATAKQELRKVFNELYHRVFDSKDPNLAYKIFLSFMVCKFCIAKKRENTLALRRKKQGSLNVSSLEEQIQGYGYLHISAKLYKLIINPRNYEEQVINFKLPENINELYDKACNMVLSEISDSDRKNAIAYFKRRKNEKAIQSEQ